MSPQYPQYLFKSHYSIIKTNKNVFHYDTVLVDACVCRVLLGAFVGFLHCALILSTVCIINVYCTTQFMALQIHDTASIHVRRSVWLSASEIFCVLLAPIH